MKTCIILLLLSLNVQAKNLGCFGETFEIIEKDLLEMITEKLQVLENKGMIAEHQFKIQEMVKEKIQRPTPVAGVIKTKEPRIFSFDPSIQVPYDLKDHQGNIFVKAGTMLNPLDLHPFRQTLIFIDGDDKAQARWAINHGSENVKVILIKGSPFELMDKHKVPIYFDQGGKLIQKFKIQQIPARVSQEAKVLKIEELLIKDLN